MTRSTGLGKNEGKKGAEAKLKMKAEIRIEVRRRRNRLQEIRVRDWDR